MAQAVSNTKSLPSSRAASPTLKSPKLLGKMARDSVTRFFGSKGAVQAEPEKKGDMFTPFKGDVFTPFDRDILRKNEQNEELRSRLEKVSLDSVRDRARLGEEQARNSRLESEMVRLRSELAALKELGDDRRDRVAQAFSNVSTSNYNHEKALQDLEAKFERFERFEENFEQFKGLIARKILKESREDNDDSSESEYENEYESPPKKINRVESGIPASQKGMFEALKNLRALVPLDLDDRYPTTWVDEGVTSIRQFFPKLTECQLIELLVKRLTKKHGGAASRDLHSCKSIDEFRKKIVGLCRQSYSAGHDTIVNFLNYVPTKVGPKTENFCALIIEILEEAEPLQSLSESELTKVMQKAYILNKCMQFMPYPIQAEISAREFQYSKNSPLEDLQEFFTNPMKTKEVERHLRTLNPRAKSIGSVGSELATEQSGGGNKPAGGTKKLNRSRTNCSRCGSGIHAASDCNWYTTHHQGPPCGPCGKSTGYALFHSEANCIQSPK